jgi:hypothetical protein
LTGLFSVGRTGRSFSPRQTKSELEHFRIGHFGRLPMGRKRMCAKCQELDEKIERYKRIASGITDELTIERIRLLIIELSDRKARLHPEQE